MRHAAALAFAALVLLPAAAARADDDSTYYYEDVYRPFFAPDPARPGWIVPTHPAMITSAFEAQKPAGVLRVFIIGGSTAGGYQGPADLQWGLSAALPGRRVEVINAGMSGYDSDRERHVLADALRYQPDVVVTISGHNDFFIHEPLPSLRQIKLARLEQRFWRALGWSPRSGSRDEESPEAREQHLRRLESNVAAHIDDIVRAGARPVVCVPPVDYEDMAPGRNSPPWADRGFTDGWIAFLAGHPDRAAAAWEARLAAQPAPDDRLAGFLWHALGRARERLGRRAGADDAFRKALDFGAGANVCGTSCLDGLRAVARRKGAVLADVDAAFIAASRPRLPGSELFGDEIHWSTSRHELVTRSIVAAMRADPALSKLGWRKGPLPRFEGSVAKEEAHHRRALLFYAVQKMDFTSDFSQRALEWLEAVDRLEPGWTATPDALVAQAVKVREEYNNQRGGLYHTPLPTTAVLQNRILGYYGAMRLEQGRLADAVPALRKAVADEPQVQQFKLVYAAALALQGSRDQALAQLDALRGSPLTHEAGTLAASLGLATLDEIPAVSAD